MDYTKNAITGQPLTPYQMSFDPGNASATSPAKTQFVANAVKTSSAPKSPGAYKGVTINAGTDADVAAQMKTIDAGGSSTTTNTNPQNPNSPNTPVQTPADDAFSSYLKSLEQPTEVTEATKYVNSLITQGKQDQETALNRGETLGFATGEAARVGRNNALTLEAAGRGLDALVASNASKKEIAKARYDYEKAKIDADKDKNKPFELSPGQERYEFDPKTGAYKKVASVAKAPEKVTAADKKAVLSTDVNNAVDQLGKIVKAKGFRGVSPDDYNEMRTYLQSEYGVDGVIELDKAMKALGLVIDTDWQKLDAKNK